MSDQLTDRLNAILPRIISDEFLGGTGIGNEIAFYIFDYPPEDELRVRQHVQFLLSHIAKQKPGLRVKHINLFDLAIDHLKSRNLIERSFKMQHEKGDDFLRSQLVGILDARKIAPIFTEQAQPESNNLILVSGIGGVWPILRTHQLINALHSKMGRTPVVFFYPGKYDGQSLRLFGKLKSKDIDPYYRAFKLVP